MDMSNLTNKQRFLNCCHSLAYIEGSIQILQDIGLLPEPGNAKVKDNDFPGYLYESCTGMIRVAMSYLNIESFKDSEKIYGDILQANPENYLQIAEEVWEKYGIE